jgi:hypothetical protein
MAPKYANVKVALIGTTLEEGRSEDVGSETDVAASLGNKASTLSRQSAPRQGSKLAEVILLLSRKKGAGIVMSLRPHDARARA